MLPTHDIPAVRCEAAAPGVEVAVGAACMAREMGPPRRGEDCAGAFTHAPVAQLAEPVRPIRTRSVLAEWVAGSSPAGRNFPSREVTK